MSLLGTFIYAWLVLPCTISVIALEHSQEGTVTGVPRSPLHARYSRDVGEFPSTSSDSTPYVYTVNIDPNNETAMDSQKCYPPVEGGVSRIPCLTLEYALKFHQYSSESVKFHLVSPTATYLLNTDITFSNVDSIAIVGNNESYPDIPKIGCDESTNNGLAFLNSSNIVLKSVIFSHCGALHDSTSKNFSSRANSTTLCNFKASLYFSNCTDVEMHHIRVVNSSQAMGTVMYNTVGKVVVNECEFTNNEVDGSESLPGGGGFAVEFTYCYPGDNNCDNENYLAFSFGHKNSNSRYQFTKCLFQDNKALSQSLNNTFAAENFILPLNTTHESFGRGGGLSVYFKGNALNNSIAIDDCQFINNQAVWGGALLIEMDDNTINNTVIISSCHFEYNSCDFNDKYGTGGGALRIATTVHFWDYTYKEEDIPPSAINVVNCKFTQNKALEGGALSIAVAHQDKSHPHQVTTITVSQCTFQSNVGRIGSAADISFYQFFIEGYLPHVLLFNCTFVDNSVNYTQEMVHMVGMGTVYVNRVPVDFGGTANFTQNLGSALAVIGAQVNFSRCAAFFINNSGSNGGGIALLGVSLLVVGSQTRMNFTDNYVSGYGGAIYNRYIGQENLKSNINCFMVYEDPFVAPKDWNVEFYFKNNSAMKLGKSIFSSSILPCSLSKHKSYKVQKVFCWDKKRWIYSDSSGCHDEINTSPSNFTVPSSLPNIYPGKDFDLRLTAFDDLQHDVTRTTIYSASVDRQDRLQLVSVDPRFAYIADNSVTINGQPSRNFTMGIETADFPYIQIKMKLKMKRCPPGFILKMQKLEKIVDNEIQGDNFACKCTRDSYRGNLRCFADELKSQISTRFWIGFESKRGRPLNNSDLLMGYFPPVYGYHRRKLRNHILLTVDNNKTLDEIVCGGEHRRGMLCGMCEKDYAVAVNSLYYECVLCNMSTGLFFGQLFGYIALTYLPIVALLFIIFYFNVKLTSSAASGFVLYAQLISSDIFSISGGKVSYLDVGLFPYVMQTMYRTVYGIFNLDSFANLLPSFCLNKNFSTLDVICLDYAIAAFPLTIIIVVHFSYQCNFLKCRKCSRKLNHRHFSARNEISSRNIDGDSKGMQVARKSLIHAFIAFILLSYTKFSLASMSSLSTAELFNSKGETVAGHQIYLAGHLSLHSARFLFPYGLLAIFVFIFIVLLPPLLLLGPLQFIDWLIEKPGFRYLHKVWPSIAVHTFLDTFQGFYKPNRRFFAGIYFLFRLVLFISYCFTTTIVLRYTIQQIVTTIMIILISIFQPYKTSFFNHVDTLLFFNLAILNAFALYSISNNTAYFSMKLYVFECILVWLPLIYMICFLTWNSVRNSKHYSRRITAIYSHFTNWRGERENQPLLYSATLPQIQHELTDSFSNTDKGIFKRAETKNMYRPTTTVKKVDGRKRIVDTTVVSLMQFASSETNTCHDVAGEDGAAANAAGVPAPLNVSTSL